DDLDHAGALGHQSGLLQREQVDLVQGQALEFGERDLRVVLQRGGLEAPLGQATLQRHLAALEAHLVEAARARLLALVAAPGRLAQARADTAPDPATRVTRAVGRLDAVEFHRAVLGLRSLRAP